MRDAVHRWCTALPADRYLIAAIPADGRGPIHRRLLPPGELDRALGWLRWLNTNGHHVFCRPWATRHLLVDDLRADVAAMLMDQNRAAAIVATSPGSLQAWLTLADGPLDPAVAGAAARLLAERLGGDRGAANPVQLGRMPSTTNRKAHHQRPDGTFPFALLHRSDGPRVDPMGTDILAEATSRAGGGNSPPHRPGRFRDVRGPALSSRSPHAEWVAAHDRIVATLPAGSRVDVSRVDIAIARRLLQRGLSEDATTTVILAGQKASRLPPVAASAYASRTIAAAAEMMARRGAPG
jgi:hypothetical protein